MNNYQDKLLYRRSIRQYKDKEIDQQTLDYILSCGIRASNCGNMQLYSIIITREESQKQKLLPLHFNQSMIENAPIILTICADINRFGKWCKYSNTTNSLDNLLFEQISTIDASLLSQAIATAAESKGIGICFLGTVNYNAQAIGEVLQLPKGVIPISCITMGYPNEEPILTERLSLNSVVHNETYKDYSKEDIQNMYRPIEENPLNQAFVKENNLDNLAQVFSQIRYNKDFNEQSSKDFKNYLNSNFLSQENKI